MNIDDDARVAEATVLVWLPVFAVLMASSSISLALLPGSSRMGTTSVASPKLRSVKDVAV